jgi:predicted dehydrogenase
MRQVFLEKGAMVINEVCQPALDEHAVLVAVHYSCICSEAEASLIKQAGSLELFSDMSYKLKRVIESFSAYGIDGAKSLIKNKLKGRVQALGYSCSGRVIAVGKKVTRFRVGDYVACAGSGYAYHADLVCVPEHFVVHVDVTILKEASTTTLGAMALHAIRKASLQLGEVVAVVGLNLIGQLVVQLAKNSGCKVIALDASAERRELAKKIGADEVLAFDTDVATNIGYMSGHNGIDAAIVTSATAEQMHELFSIMRHKGAVVITEDITVEIDAAIALKELDIHVITSAHTASFDAHGEQSRQELCVHQRWNEQRNMQAFVQLLEQKKLNIDSLIGLEVGINQIETVYEGIKQQSFLGALLTYDMPEHQMQQMVEQQTETVATGMRCTFMPARKDEFRVGVVGVGDFAKVTLLPVLSRMKDIKIQAIADADITVSMQAKKIYDAQIACADYKELLQDDAVDVMVIASPHRYHCMQAIDALSMAKAVFLEKPMATDSKQLEAYADFFKLYPNAPFVVDYNRSFAPAIKKIKQALQGRNTPVMMHYRMQVQSLAKDHWMQTEIGAGRIIGDACHIIDLFCYLIDADIFSVSVEAMHSMDEHIFPTDNFVVHLSFKDGSICSLLYTAIGHGKMNKERLELFFDGKAIVLDDYKTLEGFGLPSSFDQTYAVADKGHAALLEQFFCSLRKPVFEPPVPFDRLLRVARITLIIDALACKGGGTQDV